MSVSPALTGSAPLPEQLDRLREQIAAGQLGTAEAGLRELLREQPHCVDAWLMRANLADRRGDEVLALECASQAVQQAPEDERASMQLAQTQARAGRIAEGIATLSRVLVRNPAHYLAWLALGEALEHTGRIALAARARLQGVSRGQRAGQLSNRSNTPAAWLPLIPRIIDHVNAASDACVEQGLAELRSRFGSSELKRVEHAMAVYQGRLRDAPRSPHQAPKFCYFPGLPEGPFHDPQLQPWAAGLLESFEDIRAEALAVLAQPQGLEDFLNFKPGQSKASHLGGTSSQPAWDAFFFYRHGRPYADNQARCPRTAAALERADLCRIEGQAPEVCFSVLQPGTHIKPHHGVTNARLVMHLPLIVPADCALHVHGGGTHVWRERELLMFDDTFLHEAWNRSGQARVVLLMDCWNPHLSPVERLATQHLFEQISAFETFTAEELNAL